MLGFLSPSHPILRRTSWKLSASLRLSSETLRKSGLACLSVSTVAAPTPAPAPVATDAPPVPPDARAAIVAARVASRPGVRPVKFDAETCGRGPDCDPPAIGDGLRPTMGLDRGPAPAPPPPEKRLAKRVRMPDRRPELRCPAKPPGPAETAVRLTTERPCAASR